MRVDTMMTDERATNKNDFKCQVDQIYISLSEDDSSDKLYIWDLSICFKKLNNGKIFAALPRSVFFYHLDLLLFSFMWRQ